MELIPILSLIILVATISTFILAVGAYILYKVRERKGKQGTAQTPDSIQAELVTPTRVVAETRSTRRTETGEPIYTRTSAGEPLYTSEMEREPQMRPTFVAPRETRTNATRYSDPRYTEPRGRETRDDGRYSSSQKFKRYSNSYDTDKQEAKKEESLRWR